MASTSFLPNLSQRERRIAAVALSALAVFLIYIVAIQPFLDYRASLIDQRDKSANELRDSKLLLARAPRLASEWRDYNLQTDDAKTSAELQHAIQDQWAPASGIDLNSIQPGQHPAPDPKDDHFMQVTIQLKCSGSTAAISRFVYLVETSKLPARIMRVNIVPHDHEGTDDLTMDMTITSIYLAPPKPSRNETGPVAAVSMAGPMGQQSEWSRR